MAGMNGVEILNTTYEYGNLISPVWGFIGLIIALIICIVGLCTISYDNTQKILKGLFVIVLIGAVLCFTISLLESDEVVDTKYQVTISEEANFIEFIERYEIIEQEGKIYTVRERE